MDEQKIQPDWYKLNDGQWHHIVFANGGKMYIDGAEVKKIDESEAINNAKQYWNEQAEMQE
jgi:hypothetical protein